MIRPKHGSELHAAWRWKVPKKYPSPANLTLHAPHASATHASHHCRENCHDTTASFSTKADLHASIAIGAQTSAA